MDTSLFNHKLAPATLDWHTAAWDGVAAKKITLRSGPGYALVLQCNLSGGGGAGGCATVTVRIGVVGFTPTTQDLITSAAIPVATPTTWSPGVYVLCDANGQADVYAVPNAGTSAKILSLVVAR